MDLYNGTDTNFTSTELDSICHSTFFKVIKTLVIGPISLGGAVGNSVVIVVILRSKKLKKIFPAFLIVNLAVADFLIGSVVLPITTLGDWNFTELSCFLLTSVCISCCFASIFTLSVLSVDRYIGVTYPIRYMTIMTFKTNMFILVVIWILSVAVSLGPIVLWPIPYSKCLQRYNFDMYISKYLLFYFVGPLGIILTLYWRMYRKLSQREKDRLVTGLIARKQSNSTRRRQNGPGISLRTHTGGQSVRNSMNSGPGESRRLQVHKQKHQKIAKMFCLVTFSFAFSWLPYFSLLFLNVLKVDFDYKPQLAHIFVSVGHSSSCFNPLIYAANFRSFRKAFRDLLGCQCSKLPNESDSTTIGMQQISE